MVDHGLSYQASPQPERPLKGTVKENNVFSGYDPVEPHMGVNEPVMPQAEPAGCPRCGYPTRPDMNVCPSCGSPLKKNQVSQKKEEEPVKQCPKCGAPLHDHGKFCPNCGAPLRLGTVNNWINPSQGVFCTLKPVAWMNEGIDYQPISYSGDVIILNRANTDPNNNSITSKEQAVLTNDGTDWYIENKSEQETTFIKVSKKTKLESGDIIVLGNRLFEFKG